MKHTTGNSRETVSRSVAENLTSKPESPASSPLFTDNRPETIAQRQLQSLADNRAHRNSPRVIQRAKGDKDDPHMVKETEYKILEKADINENVIAPGVSGCAAIKFSVWGLEDELLGSIAFHSDGKADSIEAAKEIGDHIKRMKPEKVTILIITNSFENYSFDDHNSVLGTTEQILKASNIRCERKHRKLVRNVAQTMDIDLTGSKREILERYQNNFRDKSQDAIQKELAAQFIKLFNEALHLELYEPYIKRKPNRYHLKKITPGEFAHKPLDQERLIIAEYEEKINAYKNSGIAGTLRSWGTYLASGVSSVWNYFTGAGHEQPPST